MIRLSRVRKEYPRTGIALTDVSLSVGRGEFVFLTGPSGAGKTTILRMINAMEMPTSGEVIVAGQATSTMRKSAISALRRKLGVVFQDFRLLEDRTAEANIGFALEVTGASQETVSQKVARLLLQVGLASKATAFPGELSGGEQQRVAIARALAHDPIVLLADEPTGNLDDRATRGIFQLLRDVNASGTAVIMATHDLDLIARTNIRTIEINRGTVVMDSAASNPRGGI